MTTLGRPDVRSLFAVAMASTMVLAIVGCRDTQRPSGECETDDDCGEEGRRVCLDGDCVPCFHDEHCSCHERCVASECVQLASNDASWVANAHGLWDGIPAADGSNALGVCTTDQDCDAFERCNPFTGGCVVAAEYSDRCGPNNNCNDALPTGVLLACNTELDRCLPAGLCWVDDSRRDTDPSYDPDHNCCGSGFVCDAAGGEGFCVARQQDCSPPQEVTSTCPMQPRERDTCDPEFFCSRAGRCVQCTCDADCNTALRCYAPTGLCVSTDFCAQASECGAGESCDLTLNQCRSRCANDGECPSSSEYCRTPEYVPEAQADFVCRPRSELPCLPDAYESNQTAAEALANPLWLPIPSVGQEVDVNDLTLCTDDPVDWYAMTLASGDRIIIRGTSRESVGADLTALAADSVTEITAGRIEDFVTVPLDFVANYDDTYYLRVGADLDTKGRYDLKIERQAGTACTDAFEASHGADNTPQAATLLNDPEGVPSECPGSAHTVDCSGRVLDLCVGDIDYYLVQAHANARITVELFDFSSNLDLFLFGPYVAGETNDTSRLAAFSATPSILETVMAFSRPAATYLVRVSRKAGGNSSYSLVVDIVDGPTCIEDAWDSPAVNDAFADASQVAVSPGLQTLSPMQLCVGDIDWLRLGVDNGGSFEDLPPDMRVRLTLHATSQTPGDAITIAVTTDESTLVDGSTSILEPASQAFIERSSGGPYFAAVLGATTNVDTISYDLAIEVTPPPACDLDVLGDTAAGHNDVAADAFLLEPAAGWPSALGESHGEPGITLCSSDDDWYVIAVPAEVSVVASVQYDPTIAEVGLALFDASVLTATPAQGVPPSLGRLDLSDTDGRGFQRVRGTPVTTDAYLMVYNRTGWPHAIPPSRGYLLRVQFVDTTCFEDVYEENDLWGDATAIPLAPTSVPRHVAGLLDLATVCTSAGGELDWYQMDLQAGDSIEANIYYHPNEGNLQLFLYRPGPAGVNASIDDDSADAPQTGVRQVAYTVTDSDPIGDYLLKVRPYDILGNEVFSNLYMVEARVTRACVDDTLQPSSKTDPAMLVWPPAVADLALCSDDEDWYGIVAPGAGPVDIEVCIHGFVHAAGNIDLLVYEADKVTIIRGSAGETDYESATFRASGGGTYYVRVFMEQPRNQTYDLVIDEAALVTCP